MNNFTTLKNVICIVLCMAFMNSTHAQEEHLGECGTIITPEQQAFFESIRPQIEHYEQEYYEKLQNRSSTAISSVPIKAHIVRTTAGSGGLTFSQLNNAINNLNAYYANAFMEFYLCDGINYINNSNYYDFNSANEGAMTSANNVSGLINIYFVNSATAGSTPVCGYAYTPGGPDVIIMRNSCTINGTTLSHEVGHFFSLLHTHGVSNSVLTDELVNGSNCSTAGDRICDTPADPQLGSGNVNGSCVYTGNLTDANGDPFDPDTTNIMSYSLDVCQTTFTTQQYARIYAGFQTARHYFACPSFYAEFSASFTRDCSESLTVQFTDNSPFALSWQWDVDGDDVIDYTTQNPTHVYSPGTYDVALTVSNGGTTLTNVFANYIDFETDMINTTQVHLELFTDNWCEETTWEFKDSNDAVLYSGGPYIQNVEDLTLFNYAFDVDANECYSFVINDSFGDGICCGEGNGYYELTTDDDTVIVTGGQIGFSETTYMSNATLSLDDNFVDSLSLFPNPTSGVITLKLKNQSDLPDAYEIYNMLGQLVSTHKISSVSDLNIDTSSFSNGMYFLKIAKENNTATLAFIKK